MRINRTFALGLAVAALGFTPAAALASHGADDPIPAVADDNGAAVQPGDDHGTTVEPGDDNGTGVEPGDDNGVDPAGDDNGVDPAGDDKGGATKSKAKRDVGSCTSGSSSKLKVKRSRGHFETEFEVDQNRSGVSWAVRIRRDDKTVVKAHATTKGPSGSFSSHRRFANPAGSDHIVAKATSSTGEVCKASVTI
jgi:hypothetical protein